MLLKGPPFVSLNDATKGSIVYGPTQGQPMVSLLDIPPGA
jgi:hypothetical protein